MKLNKKGFTLIELIVVISIISILVLIFLPNLKGYTNKVKHRICEINCDELEKMYNGYLLLKGLEHEEDIFQEYLDQYGKDICTEGGKITYNNGKIECSFHTENDEDEKKEEVPYI